MAQNTRIVLAQLNFTVGDIRGNLHKILVSIDTARKNHQAHAIVFPELSITGYPPEDLLFRNDFLNQVKEALPRIIEASKNITVIVGHPWASQNNLYNAASILQNGKMLGMYYKKLLPNYGIFDEKRYFSSGRDPFLFMLGSTKVGVVICEDFWHKGPVEQTKKEGAELIVSLNASPYTIVKQDLRTQALQERAKSNQIPIVYAHMVGGQDELVFDGGSMAVNEQGEVVAQAETFREVLFPIEIISHEKKVSIPKQICTPKLSPEKSAYLALVTGTRDYILKNKFRGCLLGLSGGIDSALTACIAVDAIGKQNVEAIMMPSQYTSQMSLEDAALLSKKLGIDYHVVSIEPIYLSFVESLKNYFKDQPINSTEENLQARCRGTLLMAVSNKFGKLVLTTGNKSELAVGYATLYGDMAGGFNVLKDVSKTQVYQLSKFRNSISQAIPERILSRPPSAELAPNQCDQDTLPPYDILDQILELYIEQDKSFDEIHAKGFDANTLTKVIQMVHRNEYKRRQGAPGVRITPRSFGKDRRYPMTHQFALHTLLDSSSEGSPL